MKKICTLLLTAGMLMGVATGASAIDFKAKGQWNVGFGAIDTNWDGDAKMGGNDTFQAQQRVRLQIDAVASEALSGTVYFEIGETQWGRAGGGQMGTDGIAVEVKHAYIDWFVPNTMLSFRMGLQAVANPSAAGGSVIIDDDAAAVMANYKFNDMVSLTFGWIRLYNDNFNGNDVLGLGTTGETYENNRNYQMGYASYLDNIDAFILSLPVQGENWSVNPWFMMGWYGQNSFKNADTLEMPLRYDPSTGDLLSGTYGNDISDVVVDTIGGGMIPAFGGAAWAVQQEDMGPGGLWNASEDSYTGFWWAGIPITFQHEGWNFELDFNYGSVAYSGTYWALSMPSKLASWNRAERSDMSRSGWLLKGLLEYKMDWGTPGIFAWYGSGDNDDVTDGSEMMPFLSPSGNFTSFLGDGEFGWQPGTGYDNMLSYSGTWGIGLQLKDFSFVENLSHVLRIAYWGGTNDPDMVRWVATPYGTAGQGFYMVEGDYLVEVNFDTKYQIYENLAMHFQLGYVFNGIDKDHWNNHRYSGDKIDNQDAYKATLSFSYSF